MKSIQLLQQLLASPDFLLLVKALGLISRVFIFTALLHFSFRSKVSQKLWYLIVIVVGAASIIEVYWIFDLASALWFPDVHFGIGLFLLRIIWFFNIAQYLSLSLFIDNLVCKERKFKPGLSQVLAIVIGGFLSLYILWLALVSYAITNPESRPALEFLVYKIVYFYAFVIVFLSMYRAIKNINVEYVPKILAAQLKTFMIYMIFPHLLLEIISFNPFEISATYFRNNYLLISTSDMFLLCAIYFCAKKMLGLRFLNVRSHVQAKPKFNFIDDFKGTLQELGKVNNISDLKRNTQDFFKNAFGVPLGKATLYIRILEDSHSDQLNTRDEHVAKVQAIVENFMYDQRDKQSAQAKLLKQSQILIKDEIEFNNFYEESSNQAMVLEFLAAINADVFLPIYKKQAIAAYVIIERDARAKKLFSRIERDEMLVFASYLSNVINVLEHSNWAALVQEGKELKEELYRKHQEVNQYKESIRSFLRNAHERKIGLIFYKNRKFSYGNQVAQELVPLDLNMQEGHPITQACKRITRNIQQYKTAQEVITKDTQGNRLVLSGIPSLDDQTIIIMAYYPEIADVVKLQLDLLKDPTSWDYLLYLETTPSGQLINQLVPGSGQTLLNFKVDLLKIALGKKATLLDINEEDLMPTVEIIHSISMRTNLQVIRLHYQEKGFEVAMRLFGVNLLFGKSDAEPLLAELNNSGTLFIENVHLLNLETQDSLAEFIMYGYFHIFRSDHKMSSNVRVICSSTQDLQAMVQGGTFSSKLFNELKRATLTMPSLSVLPSKELNQLADACTEEAIKTTEFKKLLGLTDKDRAHLINRCPVSLQEFKGYIKQILIKKSARQDIYNEVEFAPAYATSDPELFQAVQRGKCALKDVQIMTFLWNKFRNQAKIATLLGVNRSSVNRRCREYKLIDESEL